MCTSPYLINIAALIKHSTTHANGHDILNQCLTNGINDLNDTCGLNVFSVLTLLYSFCNSRFDKR